MPWEPSNRLCWPSFPPFLPARGGASEPGGGAGSGPAPSRRPPGGRGLPCRGGEIYPHTSGNREVRGWGEGWADQRPEGRGLGIARGLRMGPLEGGRRQPGKGQAGDPAGLGPWAPGLYNTVCYKIQNLPAGTAEFVCVCAGSLPTDEWAHLSWVHFGRDLKVWTPGVSSCTLEVAVAGVHLGGVRALG